jgi:hypothetical protein
MRRLPFRLALVGILPIMGCLDPDPGPQQNYGVIGLTTVASETDTILSPEAQFYRAGRLILPSSRVVTDVCQVAAYPTLVDDSGTPRFVDAGDSVQIATNGYSTYLYPVLEFQRVIYQLDAGDQFSFSPGENVTVNVPGAAGGFASSTISIATARPFTLGEVQAAPPQGEGLPLTWTPAGDDSTKILISIQYGVGTQTANQQIFCELVDDGAYTIPELYLAAYRNATTGTRNVDAARWRISLKEVEGGVLVLISAFEVEQGIT